MDRIKKWIHSKLRLLQFRLLWLQMDDEMRLDWLREARYIYWRQQTSPDKLSPYHRKS
jgi:hypothetical protein